MFFQLCTKIHHLIIRSLNINILNKIETKELPLKFNFNQVKFSEEVGYQSIWFAKKYLPWGCKANEVLKTVESIHRISFLWNVHHLHLHGICIAYVTNSTWCTTSSLGICHDATSTNFNSFRDSSSVWKSPKLSFGKYRANFLPEGVATAGITSPEMPTNASSCTFQELTRTLCPQEMRNIFVTSTKGSLWMLYPRLRSGYCYRK